MKISLSHRQNIAPWCRAALAVLAVAALALPAAASPEIPGPPQRQPIALVGGTIHPVSGPAIEGGTLVFDHGRISAVGKNVPIPADAERVDVSGKHVYPSLIDCHSNLGLLEIPAVRASVDNRETGSVNPNVRAEVAVNPDSEIIPVTRSNGVLLAVAAPTGGVMSGTSALLQLDGWTWEEMTVAAPIALHLTWPNMVPMHGRLIETSPKAQLEARDKALEAIHRAFADAQAYKQAKQAAVDAGTPLPQDARWEAMLPVLAGRVPVMVDANEIQQIQAAVAFAQEQGVKLIIHGGYDAPRCRELLRKYDVPVIVAEVYRLPERRDDPYDAAFTLPERLRAAGIHFAIAGAGHFGGSSIRNLPYHAAMAAAFGLPADEALKAITLSPAEILGVADRVGSLDVGKDATLFIADGDPLVTATQVEAAFISGRKVELNDRHKRLWRKYAEKYRQLAPEATGK